MRVERRRKLMQANFGSVLVDAMRDTLNDKNQVILFQNRRGFSLRLECGVCHWVPQCINCDVSMTYHKAQNIMKCHYCGYTMAVPSECPSCHSTDLKMHGFGTERVEEDLSAVVPEARCARLDLDTTRSKNSYQFILDQFKNRETDILVGTQMVTKGLDFDHVKTVGILDADNMLSFPDFRAYERSFQLMEQVSGRAGRKGEKGKVIIQTYQPWHQAIRDAMDNDYHRMYDSQIIERRVFRYPPYHKLIDITLKHNDQDTLNEAASRYAAQLRQQLGDRVMGPEFPSVMRVRNQYLKKIMVRFQQGEPVAEGKRILLKYADELLHDKQLGRLTIVFDVDPQ